MSCFRADSSWEIIPKMLQPVADVPVYICGEAYCDNQGWVDGALQNAELMLQKHFHLHPPDWLLSVIEREVDYKPR